MVAHLYLARFSVRLFSCYDVDLESAYGGINDLQLYDRRLGCCRSRLYYPPLVQSWDLMHCIILHSLHTYAPCLNVTLAMRLISFLSGYTVKDLMH